MTNIESIKDKIKTIQGEIDTIKKTLNSKQSLIDSLEEEMSKMANSEYINFCRSKLVGNYFFHTFTNINYIYEWFIYAERVETEHNDEDFRLYGKTILLTYANNGGNKDKLVTITIDNNSHYLITNGWEDSPAGCIGYTKLTKIDEEEFNKSKEKINEIII